MPSPRRSTSRRCKQVRRPVSRNVGGQPARLERTPCGHGPQAALPASGSCPGSSGPAGPSPTRSCVRAASFPLGRRRSPAGVAPAAARRSGPTRSTPARSPSAARPPAARRHRHPLRAAALRQTGSDRGHWRAPVPILNPRSPSSASRDGWGSPSGGLLVKAVLSSPCRRAQSPWPRRPRRGTPRTPAPMSAPAGR